MYIKNYDNLTLIALKNLFLYIVNSFCGILRTKCQFDLLIVKHMYTKQLRQYQPIVRVWGGGYSIRFPIYRITFISITIYHYFTKCIAVYPDVTQSIYQHSKRSCGVTPAMYQYTVMQSFLTRKIKWSEQRVL